MKAAPKSLDFCSSFLLLQEFVKTPSMEKPPPDFPPNIISSPSSPRNTERARY